MAKPKRRKATLHSTGKVTEADLLSRARALADDPSLACPECVGACVFFSPVAAARKGIAKVHAVKDDEAKLERLAATGNDLVRAYAATLLIARADRLPYVADLKLPGISAPYVVRGKAKPFQLAGLLNHHDRQLRLLSVSPWARKRKLHFWSTADGIVCTGKRRVAPRAFLEAEAEELDLEQHGDAFVCAHPDADRVRLAFEGTPTTLERCPACADETPLLAEAARHVAAPDLLGLFRVEVALAPLQGAPVDASFELPADVLLAYRQGKLRDAELVEAARAARATAIKARPARALVAGDRAFADADAFLAALAPTPAEATALRGALARHEGPVVLERASAARALAELWPTHGRAMLEAAAGDAETAARLHRESVTPEQAVDLVRRADREGAHRAGLAGLPNYARLPPAAALADAVARAFRSQGAEAAARLAAERSPQAKGVALALLEAMGQAKGQEWRFAVTDQELAAALAPSAQRLLRGEPSGYHAALVDVSHAAGETTSFEPSR